MPDLLSDTFQRLPVDSITVLRDERQRRLLETSDLEKSIAKRGVLQPIIVRNASDGLDIKSIHDASHATYFSGPCEECEELKNKIILIAGERRLQACKNLGLPTIPARFSFELSPIEASIIELEENIKRSDLEWHDLVNAVARVHFLHLSIDSEWTAAETAEALSLGASVVSMWLRVASELSDPRINAAGGAREAYNIITRRDQRALGSTLEELLHDTDDRFDEQLSDNPIISYSPSGGKVLTKAKVGPLPVEQTILQESFLQWAPLYSGTKFSFIHCDFPYGTEALSGPQGQGAEPSSSYSDTPDTFFNLAHCLCTNIDRLLSLSGHIMFWYSEENKLPLLQMFREYVPSIQWQKHPLIWFKTDNAGISPDPRRLPRHVYETALIGSRGDRNIVRVVTDCYPRATDHTLHPSTKPEGMLSHFFSMLVDDYSTVLDPTCGSGSSIRAAEALGASRVLGLEIDPDYTNVARQALTNSRLLRKVT